jgi:uncharacterized protein (DUF1778 family)
MSHKGKLMATALPRITARIDEEIQELLNRAATLSGVKSINAFVVGAAVEKARAIIAQEERLLLSEEEASQLIETLDAESQAHDKLSKAFKKHSR